MVELDMSEAALQKVVAANPVAAPVDGEPAKHTKHTKTSHFSERNHHPYPPDPRSDLPGKFGEDCYAPAAQGLT